MSQKMVRKKGWTRSLVATAAGMCLAGVVMAQSTTGEVAGTAPAGATVVLKSTSAGVTRQVAVGSNGQFRVQSLPTGEYELTVGGVTKKVTVIAGQTAQADLSASSSSAQVITVVGALNTIDLGSTETRTTFTAEELNRLPVARDVTSVSLLTPGTVASSGYFGNASFGGASAAENSYYVNGFNVTNMYDILSFTEVPYQAIGQLDVQTGGYGAKYGLSTGGVTSVNVKRGTNVFKGGVSYTYSPAALREHEPAATLSDGSIFRAYKSNDQSSQNASAWLGGPIIEDKLFFFVLGSYSQNDSTVFSTRGNGYATYSGGVLKPYSTTLKTTGYDYTSKNPYGILKLDWYLTENNLLEYTGFTNKKKSQYDRYSAAYSDTTPDATVEKVAYTGKENLENGGNTNILKWTSYLTDDLTFSMQYGRMKNTNSDWTTDPNGVENKYNGDINKGPNCPYVYDYRSPDYSGVRIGCSTVTSQDIYGGSNERSAGRADIEWSLNDHKLGLGYSIDNWKSKQGTVQNLIYLSDYATWIDDGGMADDTPVYEEVNFATGGSVKIKQKAWYLEDNWKVTKDLMVYLGLRNDSYKNLNSAGKTFVEQDNIWQPRLGFTLDLTGKGDSKLYATAGRYSLPIAANVALRAASASYYTDNYYTYDGTIDPVTARPTPTGVIQKNVYNGEDGSVPDAAAVASRGLKPYTQDELIVGYQQRLKSDDAFVDGWQLGIKGTFRTVKDAIDDTCDTRALYQAGVAAGYDLSNWPVDPVTGERGWAPPSGIPGCYIYNPGKDLKLSIDLNGDGKPEDITVPGASLGPKASRVYKAITLSAEKRTADWYFNASYTWSKLTGNLEGLVKSTNGQDDTGTTSDFDFKEIMIGANGNLFNDHRHSLKMFGSYKFTPEWQVGVNALIQSGGPISCLGGGTGSFDTQYGYTGVFHTCGLGASASDRTDDPVSKLGTAGRLDWQVTLSPNVVYTPEWAKGLSLQMDVFNLFNRISATQVYETKTAYPPSGIRGYYNYGTAKYYNDPRSVRFQVQYDF
ncbi:TonB-dependent receptor [Ideonella dechloratans]|uniref:TonB-dependent receptor n=1 Tax=Ideonella dechloratans TaxID=36863 RepID=UPI0035B44A60